MEGIIKAMKQKDLTMVLKRLFNDEDEYVIVPSLVGFE